MHKRSDLLMVNRVWVYKARNYLAFRDQADLKDAITEAEKDDLKDIAGLLKALQNNDFQNIEECTPKLYQSSIDDRREEEAWTIELIHLDLIARQVDVLDQFSPEQRPNVLKEALQASLFGIQIAHRMEDYAIQVFYVMLSARTYENQSQLDEAAKAYTHALTIYRNMGQPSSEVIQSYEARVLCSRGDILKNLYLLKDAQRDYNDALSIFRDLVDVSPDIYDPHLASALDNRGIILRELGCFEDAKKDHTDALAIYRKLAVERPKEYEPSVATSLNNRANALSDLNLFAEAERDYSKALKIRQKLANWSPFLYEHYLANTLNSHSNMLHKLNRLEEALKECSDAVAINKKLTNTAFDIFSGQLANSLNSRGILFSDLERLEEAESDYNEALAIYRKLSEDNYKEYALYLAAVLDNRAVLYAELKRLEEAESDCSEALEIYNKPPEGNAGAYQLYAATCLNNRGILFSRLKRFEEAENDYSDALNICRELSENGLEINQLYEAGMLNNLANVLNELHRSNAAEKFYKKSIEISRRIPGGQRALYPFSRLGALLNSTERFSEALEYLEEGVGIVELHRSLGTGLERRMQVIKENSLLYDQLLLCLMRLKRFKEAIEVAEKGRSRTLGDMISLNELMPKNAPPEIGQEYKKMLLRSRGLSDKLQDLYKPSSGRSGLLPAKRTTRQAKQIESDRHELMEVQGKLFKLAEKIREYDPGFHPHAKPLNFDEIKDLSKEARLSLVLFRVTRAGSFVFLVFPDGEMAEIELQKFTSERLREMLVKFDDSGNRVDGWLHHYTNYCQLPRSEKRRDRWFEVMERVTADLYEELLKYVHDGLNSKFGKSSKKHKIVLVPSRGLAILPLHACWWQENGKKKYLLDEFTVSYAPSLSVYKSCHEREKKERAKGSLFGIANPDPPGNLVFSEWECAEIVRMLGPKNCQMLWRDEATKQELIKRSGQRNWLHFSCHGEYSIDRPLESAILLAGRDAADRLTLEEILEQVNLPDSSLVVLSACETGLVDFRKIADEHYGLPIGFICAGAPTVWCSLWAVNEPSTALLMIKAYDELLKNQKSKPEALITAQKWLRDATRDEIIDFAEQRGKDVDNGNVLLPQVKFLLSVLNKDYGELDKPFSHPYFWAGMQCVGV